MEIIKDKTFEFKENSSDHRSNVFEVLPNVFKDNRGSFSEVLKGVFGLSWIKQINRSVSSARTIRGCHAQKGEYCQAKLVEAINTRIYDIITDARPDSTTFGTSKIYLLDPEKQNKLWVPRGFLHAFVVPETDEQAIFQYFCDNVYDKESEVGVNPATLIPKIVELTKQTTSNQFDDLYQLFETNNFIMSEKDMKNTDYEQFMSSIKSEYETNGNLWYKGIEIDLD